MSTARAGVEASCAAVLAAGCALEEARRRRNEDILAALASGESMYSVARRAGMSETAVRLIRDGGRGHEKKKEDRPR